MHHIVLLGDSIFDNGAYTAGGPSVIEHLRQVLPPDWTATLRAVDGATTASIAPQLAHVPSSATHLVVSVGGNDALGNIDLLSMRVASSAEALSLFAARLGAFDRAYREAIAAVLVLERPVIACTIYNGALSGEQARLARISLMMFNDTICRVAFSLGVDLIDLRAVCDEPEDYANPIEPSATGGRKIALAIATACGARPARHPSRVWSG